MSLPKQGVNHLCLIMRLCLCIRLTQHIVMRENWQVYSQCLERKHSMCQWMTRHMRHGCSSCQERVDNGSGVERSWPLIREVRYLRIHKVKHSISPTWQEMFLNNALIFHIPDNCEQTGGTIGPRVVGQFFPHGSQSCSLSGKLTRTTLDPIGYESYFISCKKKTTFFSSDHMVKKNRNQGLEMTILSNCSNLILVHMNYI